MGPKRGLPLNTKRNQPDATHVDTPTPSDFTLERYKHVLTEQAALDANTQASFRLFQSIVTATLGAVSLVVLQSEDWSMTLDASIAVVRTAALLIVLTGAAFLATIVGNALSWFDLRKEEQRLARAFADATQRNDPSFRNFWRWKEFYLTLMVASWTIAGAWLLLGPYSTILQSAQ